MFFKVDTSLVIELSIDGKGQYFNDTVLGQVAQHKPHDLSVISSVFLSLLAPYLDIINKLKFLFYYVTPSLLIYYLEFLIPLLLKLNLL